MKRERDERERKSECCYHICKILPTVPILMLACKGDVRLCEVILDGLKS